MDKHYKINHFNFIFRYLTFELQINIFIVNCSIDVTDTVKKVQKWASSATNYIDSEDALLVEQVNFCLKRFEKKRIWSERFR